MKEVTVEQNSKEWLELRQSRLGASDANIVMGLSKFCTPSTLAMNKAYPDTVVRNDNTFITDRGHRLEEKTRAYAELETGLDFPAIVALSEGADFLMASLDGYNEKTKTVLECKYVGASDYEVVKSGECLKQYFPQLQQQMLVTGSLENILVVCKIIDKDESKLEYAMTTVKFDEDYCFNKLIPAMSKFWDEVIALKENKDHEPTLELTKDDKLDMSEDVMMESLVEKYKVASKELEQKTAYRDELKKMIFKNINHKNVMCNNVHIQSIDVKGRSTIDFKKFVSDNNYTVPVSYIKTGKPSVTRKITIKKEE